MTLCNLLGIDLPIIQAPMAGVQDTQLAIAVSEAGGLGSLPCAMLDAKGLRESLQTLQDATSKPINLNFFSHTSPLPDEQAQERWREQLAPYYRELELDPKTVAAGPSRVPFDQATADIVCEFSPAVVSFHFGLPSSELLEQLRSCGTKILSTATTVEEAVYLEAQGVDAIIAQGFEAGGHRGMFLSDDYETQVGTFALLPQLVAAVNTPIIATGGIADAKGVQAAMALGAAAVQVGTAYLLCPEAKTSAVHRQALKSPAAQTTALTNVFSGRPARGIVNRLMRDQNFMSDCAPAFPSATAAVAPLRAKAESQGSGDFSPLWAGQNISGCEEIPAKALTLKLAQL